MNAKNQKYFGETTKETEQSKRKRVVRGRNHSAYSNAATPSRPVSEAILNQGHHQWTGNNLGTIRGRDSAHPSEPAVQSGQKQRFGHDTNFVKKEEDTNSMDLDQIPENPQHTLANMAQRISSKRSVDHTYLPTTEVVNPRHTSETSFSAHRWQNREDHSVNSDDLKSLFEQTKLLEQQQRENAASTKRLEERINSHKVAYGECIQRALEAQRAVERRRELLKEDTSKLELTKQNQQELLEQLGLLRERMRQMSGM